jgi:putative membrane protein
MEVLKTKKYIAVLAGLLLVLWFVPVHAYQGTTQTAPSSHHDMKSMQGNQGEGEVVAFLTAVDEHEVAVGKEAEQKSTNSSVKDFAQTMVKDHSKHLEDLQQLSTTLNIQSSETPMIKKLQAQGTADLDKLSKDQGADFDRAYMDQMVKGHSEALKTIDNHCMKNATDPQLKSFLETTRATVASHLEEAKKIQASIKKTK